jgi:hypothetical protein
MLLLLLLAGWRPLSSPIHLLLLLRQCTTRLPSSSLFCFIAISPQQRRRKEQLGLLLPPPRLSTEEAAKQSSGPIQKHTLCPLYASLAKAALGKERMKEGISEGRWKAERREKAANL